MMPSKQSETVRRRWEAARLAMTQPDGEGPDDESWGDLTAEPRGVDYLETEAGGVPAMWAVPAGSRRGSCRAHFNAHRAICSPQAPPPEPP